MIALTKEKPPPAITMLLATAALTVFSVVVFGQPKIIPTLVAGCICAAFLCLPWRKWLSTVRFAWCAIFADKQEGKLAEDTGAKCLTATKRYESFKESFSAARLIGRQKQLLRKYNRRYGHRPDVAELVQRAYMETCR